MKKNFYRNNRPKDIKISKSKAYRWKIIWQQINRLLYLMNKLERENVTSSDGGWIEKEI
jgi:hypothetical protein